MLFSIKFLLKICGLIILHCQVINSINEVEYEEVRLTRLREIANELQNNLNKDVDPCENFYSHVCSSVENQEFTLRELVDYNFVKNLKDDDPKISKSELKLKNYIKSCESKDENLLEQIKNLEIAEMMGGWPFFTADWNSDDTNVAKIYGTLNRYGISTNLLIYDKPVSDVVTLTINPDLFYTESDMLAEFEKFKIKTDYFNIQDVVKDIVQFNEKTIPFAAKTDTYETIALKDLKEKISGFDWDVFFEAFYGKPATDIKIRTPSVEDLEKFINFLENYDKKVLANYIMWKMIVNEEYPLGNKDCNVDYQLYVFNSLAAKIKIRKQYNKFNEKLYLESLEETKNVLDHIKQKNLITDSTFDLEVEKVNKKIDYFKKNVDRVVGNDEIDEFFHDLEIKPNNYLQNYYNYKVKHINMKRSENRTNEISKLFEYFDRIFETGLNPSFYVFRTLNFMYWEKFVTGSLKEVSSVDFMEVKCANDLSPSIQSNEDLLVFNEVLYLTRLTYEKWLEKNPEIRDKENKILAEFKLNNKDLLTLYATRNACHRFRFTKPQSGYIVYSNNLDILNNCPDDKSTKCTLYENPK